MKNATLLSSLLMVLLFPSYKSEALVSAYVFSQTNTTYTPITGGTNAIAAFWDDNNSAVQNIGFSFTFNAITYTQFYVNSNGYLLFGGTLAAAQYSPISAAGAGATGVVAALAHDLWDNAGNPIKYQMTGSAPNRVLTVQWTNASAFIYSENLNFQIKLYETSNKVEVVYGPFSTQLNTSVQVGLRGAGNTDFNDRSTASNWSATTAGAVNSASCALTTGVFPASGLTFDWIKQSPCTGTPGAPAITNAVLTSTMCPGFIDTLTATDPNAAFTGITFFWQKAPSASGPWTNITGATTLTYITPALTTTTWYRIENKCANSGSIDSSVAYRIPIANPTILTTSPGARCGPGTVLLSVTANGNVNWYAQPTYGPLLGTGLNFTTPSLTTTTTYYAEVYQGNCFSTRVPVTASINPTVAPTVSISASPNTTVCSGTPVTFTATATNPGANPLYQWLVNGVQVGPHAPTFVTYTLNNGDAVTCTLTSTTNCVSPASVISNSLTMGVIPSVTPAVTVTANPGNVICTGTSVTFTATVTNGGANPAYLWKKNGNTVSTTNTYTSSTLNNGDVITCELTSNATCAVPGAVISTPITMTVNPIVTPSVSIIANPGNNICLGTSVTFTATPVNGGSLPSYQWRRNGTVVAGTSNYTNAALVNGDVIDVILTSNVVCATVASVTSNPITMTVNPLVTPSVAVSVNPGNTVCHGVPVTFTAIPTNGGNTPGYQWKKNGVIQSTSFTYTDNTLNNGDVITVTLISSACASPATVTSAPVNMIIIGAPTATANPGGSPTICENETVTIHANALNGLLYQWLQNGAPIGGATDSTYVADLTANYSVQETSSNGCSNISAPVAIVVTPIPDATINLNGPSSFCQGDSVNLYVAQGAGFNYTWKENGSSVGFNFSSTAGSTGDYQSIVSNGNCSDTDVVSLLQLPLPVPVITYNGLTMWTVGPYVTYQWYLNGNKITGATNFIYTAPGSGTYTVEASNADGCKGTSAPQDIIALGVGNVATSDAITLYPNPNNGVFTVSGTIGSDDSKVQVEVIDEMGRVLYKDEAVIKANSINKEVRLDKNMAAGIYLLRISAANTKTVIPFRIQ